jgi:hypothetical protein
MRGISTSAETEISIPAPMMSVVCCVMVLVCVYSFSFAFFSRVLADSHSKITQHIPQPIPPRVLQMISTVFRKNLVFP